MSFIKIIMGNRKDKDAKDASCCSDQIIEVSDNDNNACCESETSKQQQHCCGDEKESKISCCP